MPAYYNENDPAAAMWLRELIKAGHIASGEVDERSIEDVRPSDLAGFAQCHFFAGIGGWSYALRLAGWPDGKPVWTGSCPCQPFSAAGKGAGFADKRHLWPAWFNLIRECSPHVVFGEQVANSLTWFDLVSGDLEGEGYAVGSALVGAHSVGAPHIRQRLYFVADSNSTRLEKFSEQSAQQECPSSERSSAASFCRACGASIPHRFGEGRCPECAHHELAESESQQRDRSRNTGTRRGEFTDGCGMEHATSEQMGIPGRARQPRGSDGELGNAARDRRQQRGSESSRGCAISAWDDADWLPCIDGKARPVESGTFPLAHGIPGRVGLLRGYGNAIVPQVAAEFIAAYWESRKYAPRNWTPRDARMMFKERYDVLHRHRI